MIAWLGTGLLGTGFVKTLRKRGVSVQVWNRSPGRTAEAVAAGAVAFASAAEAVRGADRVHVCVKDDASVDEVLEAARQGLAPGAVIIDHTTTSVEGAIARTKLWAERGTPYLHAPVFMTPQNALDAQGIILASGEQKLFDLVKDELAPMTGAVRYEGADPGKAAGVKLLGNLLFMVVVGGLRDVLSLAKALNIPSTYVSELVGTLAAGPLIPSRLNRILTVNHADPAWELQMARKDVGLMLTEAQRGGGELTMAPALAGVMDEWIARGHGHEDWTVIARDVR